MSDFYFKDAKDLSCAEIDRLWTAMSDDRAAQTVFYDCQMTREALPTIMTGPGQAFVAVYDLKDQPLAFYWLNGWTGQVALLHFGFLRPGLPLKLEIGRLTLESCFKGLGLACVLSLTPAYNLPAIQYARALGGEVSAHLPGACYSFKQNKHLPGALIKFVPVKEEV